MSRPYHLASILNRVLQSIDFLSNSCSQNMHFMLNQLVLLSVWVCFEFELRQVNYLFSIFYLKINFIHHNFRFYNMWIYPLSHSATKTTRAPCYHKFYFDFQSPLLAYSLLASPARLSLMLPISIAAANTANTLFTHICHCFTVTCFNGGFVSTFGCRWGHVRVAFSAAGAGGCGEVDPRAAGDSGPAKGAESNAGNIPGWRSQVRGMQRTANTPTTSNLCVTLHRPCAPTCTDTRDHEGRRERCSCCDSRGVNGTKLWQTETLKRDFRSLIEMVRSTSPTTMIIVLKPLPTYRQGHKRFSRVFALNEWLLWCKDQKLLFVNNLNLFWEHPRVFRADGLHPSRVGAELLSDNISRTLRSIWLASQFSNNCYDDFCSTHLNDISTCIVQSIKTGSVPRIVSSKYKFNSESRKNLIVIKPEKC